MSCVECNRWSATHQQITAHTDWNCIIDYLECLSGLVTTLGGFITTLSGMQAEDYDYLVYYRKAQYHAKEGLTGQIMTSRTYPDGAIQYGLDNGQHVHLKTHTYEISGTIYLNNKNKLTGDGPKNTVIKLQNCVSMGGVPVNMMELSLATDSYIIIKQVGFDGNKANQNTPNISLYLNGAGGVGGIYIGNCILWDSTGDGINCEADDTTIEFTQVLRSNLDGIGFNNVCGVMVDNCFLKDNRVNGIVMSGTMNSFFMKNHVRNSGVGGIGINELGSSDYNIITNNNCVGDGSGINWVGVNSQVAHNLT